MKQSSINFSDRGGYLRNINAKLRRNIKTKKLYR